MTSSPVTTPAQTINATVRMRISSRDDINRDIREWAKPTRRSSEDGTVQDADQTTVIGGQLKDNITEQRMLENRLYDLSRERYKFMVQVAWQRKAFLDKQKRKTGMMKDLLKGVDMTTTQPGKKNQSERLQQKTQTYKDLVDSSYGEMSRQRKQRKLRDKAHSAINECDDSLLEKKLIFPKPIATASFTQNRRVFQTEVPKHSRELPMDNTRKPPTDNTRSFPLDKRKVVFPAIQDGGKDSSTGGMARQRNLLPVPEGGKVDGRHSQRLDGRTMIDGRQSVPLNFMRRDVQRQNSGLARPRTEMNTRHSISAGCLPRFLKYRASYDTRFSKLERLLTIPYDGSDVQVSTGVDDMSSLLKQLPTTTPTPTIAATPLPT